MLLETLVSISLIAVVMAAFTTFFVNSVAFTSQQRATQIATQIANSAVEAIRALPAPTWSTATIRPASRPSSRPRPPPSGRGCPA